MKKFLVLIIFLIFMLQSTAFAINNRDWSKVTTDRKIIQILDNINFSDSDYNALIGIYNSKIPVNIEFKDLSKVNNNYKDSFLMYDIRKYKDANIEGNKLSFYINDKYKNSPYQALSVLFLSYMYFLLEDDNCLNKEIYFTSLRAAMWIKELYKNPELAIVNDDCVNLLNFEKNLYINGNYTSKYIKNYIKEINPNLPISSKKYKSEKVYKLEAKYKIKKKSNITSQQDITNSSHNLKGVAKPQLTVKVDTKKYSAKLKEDNNKYYTYKKSLKPEQYKIYRIVERIIRANNLDFQNWRVSFEYDPKNINAYATAGNLIIIQSALYDSLHNNDDALAFIISHEFAHLLLKHNQISLENNLKIQRLEQQILQNQYNSQYYNIASRYSNNNAEAISYGALSLLNSLSSISNNSLLNSVFAQERELEYIADNEGFYFMTKAGYNLDKALETFNLLASLPNVYTNRSTHPPVQKRMENFLLNKKYVGINWQNEGKNNIINSNVLKCEKSMDGQSIIIDKTPDYSKKWYYESKKYRYQRIAYGSYNNGELNVAIPYLRDLANTLDNTNYLHSLYLSYAYEYYYWQTKKRHFIKASKYWAKRAYKIRQNEYTTKQLSDINLATKTK